MKKSIIRTLNRFGWKQWTVMAAFVLVLGFTCLQIFRTAQHAIYWRQHRDEPIAGWMRIGYVANSYHVPPPVLNRAIGLPPDARDRRPLAKIAESQTRPFEEIKAELEKAINDYRLTHQPDAGGEP